VKTSTFSANSSSASVEPRRSVRLLVFVEHRTLQHLLDRKDLAPHGQDAQPFCQRRTISRAMLGFSPWKPRCRPPANEERHDRP